MSHFIIRVKNDIDLKSRILSTLFAVNTTYSVKEYMEKPDPGDDRYSIISFTSYEKSPYCPLREILNELIKNKEIEYLNKPSAD
jgi:hypothetical protein